MTEAFRETLERINGQAAIFADREEKAVEFGVILPLLEQLGWNTHDVEEVYPQRVLSNGRKPDFDLQIGGVSRVVIEVKQWNIDLNANNENQVQEYCKLVKPRLAALTNGHRWWLYVEPWTRLKGGMLHLFLDFDVSDDPECVERNFRQFLARENLAAQARANSTVNAAKALYKKQQTRAEIMRRLTEAWNDLTTDENRLFEAVKNMAESRGIHIIDEKDIEGFIGKSGSLVNQVPNGPKPTADHSKPEYFTVQKAGEEALRQRVNDWTGVRVGVCRLMLERDSERFHKFVSQTPEWFFDAPGQYRREIENTGIFVPTGGTRDGITKVCRTILAEFGYLEDALTIQMKRS